MASEQQARRKAATDSMFGGGVTVAVYRSTDADGRCYGYFTRFGQKSDGGMLTGLRVEVVAIYRGGKEIGI